MRELAATKIDLDGMAVRRYADATAASEFDADSGASGGAGLAGVACAQEAAATAGDAATRRSVAPQMTVVLPVFNEAASLPRTLEKLERFATARGEYRFLFVNDGSTDGTHDMLAASLPPIDADASAARHNDDWPAITYLSYSRNRGKGAAIRTAFELPRTEQVCFMDGDMAYSLDHLDVLSAALADHDVAIGCRDLIPSEVRSVWLPRRLTGGMFNLIARWGCGLPFRDTQAGLKAFRTAAARRIFPLVRQTGFTFDVEVLYIAQRLGLRIGQVPARVSAAHRRRGSNLNLLTHPPRMLADLARIRWNGLRGKYG